MKYFAEFHHPFGKSSEMLLQVCNPYLDCPASRVASGEDGVHEQNKALGNISWQLLIDQLLLYHAVHAAGPLH